MDYRSLKNKQTLAERYKSFDRKFTSLEESRQLRAINKKQEQKNLREQSLAKFRAMTCTTPLMKPNEKATPSTGTKKYTKRELQELGRIRYKEMLKWKEERKEQLEKEKNSRKPSFKSGVYIPDTPKYLSNSKTDQCDHATPSKFSQTLAGSSTKKSILTTPSVPKISLGTKKTLVFHTGVTPLPDISSSGIARPVRKRSQRTFRPPPELGVSPLPESLGIKRLLSKNVDSFAPSNFSFKAPKGLEIYNLKQSSSVLKSLSNLSSKGTEKNYSKESDVVREEAKPTLTEYIKKDDIDEEAKENDPLLKLENEDVTEDKVEEPVRSTSVEEEIDDTVPEDHDICSKEDLISGEESKILDTKKSSDEDLVSEDNLMELVEPDLNEESVKNKNESERSDDENDVFMDHSGKDQDEFTDDRDSGIIKSEKEEEPEPELRKLESNTSVEGIPFNLTENIDKEMNTLREEHLVTSPHADYKITQEDNYEARGLSVKRRARSLMGTPPLSKLRPRTPCSRSTRRSRLAHCNTPEHHVAATPKSTKKRGRKSSMVRHTNTVREQTEGGDTLEEENTRADSTEEIKEEVKEEGSHDDQVGETEDVIRGRMSLNIKTPASSDSRRASVSSSEDLSAKRIRQLVASPWITRSRGSSSSRAKKRRSIFESNGEDCKVDSMASPALNQGASPALNQGASPSFKENQNKLLELLKHTDRVPDSPESCVWGPDTSYASPVLAEESKLQKSDEAEEVREIVPLTPALKTGKRGRPSKRVSLMLPTDEEPPIASTTKYPVTPIRRRSSTSQRVSLLPGLGTHNEEPGLVPPVMEGEDLISWGSPATNGHVQEKKKRGRKSRQSLMTQRVSLLPGLNSYPEEGKSTSPVGENTDLISWDSPLVSQTPGTVKRRKSRKSLNVNTPIRRSTRRSHI